MNISENWYTSYHWHKNNTGKVSLTTGVWFKRYEVLSLLHSQPTKLFIRGKKSILPFYVWQNRWMDKAMGQRTDCEHIFWCFPHLIQEKNIFALYAKFFAQHAKFFAWPVSVTPRQSGSPQSSQRHPWAVCITCKQSASPLSTKYHLFKNPQHY